MEMPEAKVRMHNGSPALFINGKPVSAHCYSEYRGPTAKHHKQFADAGVRIYELSGQLLPGDVPDNELFQKGIAPHQYAIKPGSCVDVSLCWTGPSSSDFTWLDRSVDEVLKGDPDAYIFPRVWLEPPGWWLDSHPSELQQYADGFTGFDPNWGGSRRVSFASKVWYSEAGEALKRFMEHLKVEYAPYIIGFHLAAGIWGEWHYPSMGHLPDTSEPMRKAFIAFARSKYGDDVSRLRHAWKDDKITFEDIKVPLEAERCKMDLGIFRDPSVSRRVIDYYYCHHHVLSEAVLNFARITKEMTKDRSLVGIFYGYTRNVGSIHEGGHLSLQPILHSPYIDFLCSPHTYRQRDRGLDGGFRALPDSIIMHNKFFLDEQDEITHIFKAEGISIGLGGIPPISKDDAINLARRQFVQALTYGFGAWWFELTRDRFDNPDILEAVSKMVRIDEESLRRPRNRVSEIVAFASLESIFFLSHWRTFAHRLNDELLNAQWSELFRMGAPFDVYEMDDIAEEEFPKRYRCFIFLNTFYVSDRVRSAVERLKKDGHVLVWFFAPGVFRDETQETQDRTSMLKVLSENASELTGFNLEIRDRALPLRVKLSRRDSEWTKRFPPEMTWGLTETFSPSIVINDKKAAILAENLDGNPGWAVKNFKDWTSVYFYGPNVPSPVLREVARKAGCHIYLETNDNLYLNQSYVGVHASSTGTKKIQLPKPVKVKNLFNAKQRPTESPSFKCSMKGGETILFSIEPKE